MKRHLLLSALTLAIASAVHIPPAQAQAPAADMAAGEVRKVDTDTRKITLKHGEIKNLDMPGMTMVFQVKDAAMLERVKPGDKVKFRAERLGGAIVLTELELAP